MASKMDFKTVQTDNENLEEIEEKIRKHRRRIIRRFVIAVIVIVTIGVCFQLWSALRTYSKYEVRSKTERQDSVAAKYTTFLGKLVEYNNDGIIKGIYKDAFKEEPIYSGEFTDENKIKKGKLFYSNNDECFYFIPKGWINQ